MKALYTLILTLLTWLPISGTAQQFSGGDGSIGNPWQIATWEDLKQLQGQTYNGVYFKQTRNIDAGATTSTAVDNAWRSFSLVGGEYNGSGFEIANLKIAPVGIGAGFVGSLSSGARLIGVDLVDATCTADGSISAVNGSLLVAEATQGFIVGCRVKGVLTLPNGSFLGGVLGHGIATSVQDCFANVTISGKDYIGGAIGSNSNSQVSDIRVIGSVTGNYRVGGAIGDLIGCDLTNMDANTTVNGYRYVSGLVGYMQTPNSELFRRCIVKGTVTGNAFVTGIIYCDEQLFSPSISDVFLDVDLFGTDQVHGITNGFSSLRDAIAYIQVDAGTKGFLLGESLAVNSGVYFNQSIRDATPITSYGVGNTIFLDQSQFSNPANLPELDFGSTAAAPWQIVGPGTPSLYFVNQGTYNSVKPSFTGTLTYGQTLSAVPGTFYDPEGLNLAFNEYYWQYQDVVDGVTIYRELATPTDPVGNPQPVGTVSIPKEAVGNKIRVRQRILDQHPERPQYVSVYSEWSTATVAKVQLTMTNTANTSIFKTYDATTNVTAGLSGYGLAGVINGDAVTLPTTTIATMADKHVGGGKALTFDITLQGADAAAYTLVNPTDIEAIVTPTQIIALNVAVDDKVYDGTTNVVGFDPGPFSGKIDGDDVSIDQGTLAYQSKNVGTNLELDGELILVGSDAGNYAFGFTRPTPSITPKPLNVSGNVVTKAYDGTTHATVNVGVSGIEQGDSFSFEKTHSFSSALPGENIPVVVNFTLSGPDADNYTLDSVTLYGTITQVELTFTIDNKRRHLLEVNPELTYQVSGLVSGDSVATAFDPAPVLTVETENITDTGSYNIIFSSYGSSALYSVPPATAGTLTVYNNAPEFSVAAQNVTISENSPVGTDVGTPFMATDADFGVINGETLTLQLATGSDYFDLTEAGQLQVAANIDYEVLVNKTIAVTLEAVDASGAKDTATMNVTITDVNDRPVINETKLNQLVYSLTEDEVDSVGVEIGTFFAEALTDDDENAVNGLAISYLSQPAFGAWQYKLADGAWMNIPAVDPQVNEQVFLLPSTAHLRFQPDTENGGYTSFEFFGWDETSGTPVTLVDFDPLYNTTTTLSNNDGQFNTFVLDVNDPMVVSNLDQRLQTLPGEPVLLERINMSDVDRTAFIGVNFSTETPEKGELTILDEEFPGFGPWNGNLSLEGPLEGASDFFASMAFVPAPDASGTVVFDVTVLELLDGPSPRSGQTTEFMMVQDAVLRDGPQVGEVFSGQIIIQLSYFTEAALTGGEATFELFVAQLLATGIEGLDPELYERYREELGRTNNQNYILNNLELITAVINQVNSDRSKQTLIVEMVYGWNLISCPFANWSPADSLDSAQVSGTVYSFKNEKYISQPVDQAFEPGLGYWVYVDEPRLRTEGTTLQFVMFGDEVTERTTPLETGWNLFGPMTEDEQLADYTWTDDNIYIWNEITEGYVQAENLTMGLGYWGHLSEDEQFVDASLSSNEFEVNLEAQTLTTTVDGNYDYLKAYVYDETGKEVVFPMQRIDVAKSGDVVLQLTKLNPNSVFFVRLIPVTQKFSGLSVDVRVASGQASGLTGIVTTDLDDIRASWSGSQVTVSIFMTSLEWKAVQRNGRTIIAENSGQTPFSLVGTSTQVETDFNLSDGDYIVISVRAVDENGKPLSVWKTFTSKANNDF